MKNALHFYSFIYLFYFNSQISGLDTYSILLFEVIFPLLPYWTGRLQKFNIIFSTKNLKTKIHLSKSDLFNRFLNLTLQLTDSSYFILYRAEIAGVLVISIICFYFLRSIWKQYFWLSILKSHILINIFIYNLNVDFDLFLFYLPDNNYCIEMGTV